MQIIEDRRALHRIPEPDMRIPKTMAYLRQVLEGLHCRLLSPIPNSICAWFDFGAEKTIAFRADCDALPITEQTGLTFSSTHPGYMHACGHDGHMAIGLELARRLDRKTQLGCNVLLVFQPAEETVGGAKPLCDSGVFQQYGVEAIFGLHLWPGLEAGVLYSRKGPLMSRISGIEVNIQGRSAHIGKSWEAIDAVAAGVEFYRRARALEQNVVPGEYRLLNFGKLHSGTASNIISGHSRLEGSIRTFNDAVFDYLHDNILQIAAEIEQQFGCTVSITFSEGYPAVINDAALLEKVHALADFRELDDPTMISEDFSFYQKILPGVFFFLGLGDTPALHTNTFQFDEMLLLKGADFFETLAQNYR